MPATVRSEFSLALNQVATERGLDPKVVLETIRAAILAAYRKDYGTEEMDLYTVDVDADTGEAKVLKEGKDVTPPGFGRIAAQTAKQVILQRIREAEKQAVLADYQTKVGNIVPGMILRFDGPNVVVDIGRTQAVMPMTEQNQGERYHLNQRLTFYIEGIRETPRGNEIIVSRAHKGLVEGLFAREVPEVAQGAVELRTVVREAGGRTKVAVFSKQSGVDPVGSCVGQKGVRVTAVINELGGNEKVDIIQWSDEPKAFIIAALAPAKDIDVALDEANKTATVKVPEDQLSLAIGREGQNVRLAAKLTGWKIDIQGKAGTVIAPEAGKTEEAAPAVTEPVTGEAVETKEDVKKEEVVEEKVEKTEAVKEEKEEIKEEEKEQAKPEAVAPAADAAQVDPVVEAVPSDTKE